MDTKGAFAVSSLVSPHPEQRVSIPECRTGLYEGIGRQQRKFWESGEKDGRVVNRCRRIRHRKKNL